MQQIDKNKLKQILDKQYDDCLKHITMQAEAKVKELSDYNGDELDIKLEIIIGHSMENKICQTSYADYYNKDSIIVDVVPEAVEIDNNDLKRATSTVNRMLYDMDGYKQPSSVPKGKKVTTTTTILNTSSSGSSVSEEMIRRIVRDELLKKRNE
jgi:hypothetical protein